MLRVLARARELRHIPRGMLREWMEAYTPACWRDAEIAISCRRWAYYRRLVSKKMIVWRACGEPYVDALLERVDRLCEDAPDDTIVIPCQEEYRNPVFRCHPIKGRHFFGAPTFSCSACGREHDGRHNDLPAAASDALSTLWTIPWNDRRGQGCRVRVGFYVNGRSRETEVAPLCRICSNSCLRVVEPIYKTGVKTGIQWFGDNERQASGALLWLAGYVAREIKRSCRPQRLTA